MVRIHKIRVYVDTSVFGGIEDQEFADASKKFFKKVVQGEFTVLLSAQTLLELSLAPQTIRNLLKSLKSSMIEEIPLNAQVQQLAQSYIDAGVLGQKWESDCLHVAAATVANTELILSWNFKHIVEPLAKPRETMLRQ